ncbi:MAG: hypothetical protein ABIQ52_06660 [Vicinamibacterales bacterium]
MKSAQEPDNEWQRIWFSIRQQGWTSLALVPSHSGIDAVKVAEAFAATGRIQGERPVKVINATGVHLEGVQHLIESVAAAVGRGEWVIVPVDAIAENPSAIAIVQAASAALLLVRLGESLLASAQNAIEAVGRERFLGSVVLDESSNAVLR